MNFLKKGLAVLLVIMLGFSNISFASLQIGEKETMVKEIIDSRGELKKLRSGEKYIKSIDKHVSHIRNDAKKINKLQDKLLKIEEKLEGKTDHQSKQLTLLIAYLNAKLALAKSNLMDHQEEKNSILNQVKNSNVTNDDKELVEERLVTLQLNFLESSENLVEKLISDFEKLSKYKEAGDFKMDFNLDMPNAPVVDAYLNLNNYEAIANNFDSRLKTGFQVGVDMHEEDKEKISLQIQGVLDFISKEGGIYAMLDKYEVVSKENVEQLENMLNILQEIAEENGYVIYSDPQSQQAMELLKSLSPNKFFADTKDMLGKPMFTAYKKEGNKYYIIPTKYACDTVKKLTHKFDPFNGSICTQGQYEDLLEKSFNDFSLYVEIAPDTTKLGFEMKEKRGMEEAGGYIIFTDSSIENLFVSLIPDQKRNPGEEFLLDYKKFDHLNVNINVNKQELLVDMDSILNNNNKFTYIDAKGKSKGYRDTLDWNIGLKNNTLSGELNYDGGSWNKYDYKTGEYKTMSGTVFHAVLKGQTDSNQSLTDLNITYQGNNNAITPTTLDGSFIVIGDKIIFENEINGPGSQSKIDLSAELHDLKNTLRAFELSAIIETKKKEWSSENYSYNYTGDFEEVFYSQITLDNTVITGKTIIRDSETGEEIISIDSKGKYQPEILILNSELKLEDIYTRQIEKARDSIRIRDIKTLQSAIEQVYQDYYEYPTQEDFIEKVSTYLYSIPKDPLGNIEKNGCKFGYKYEVGDDENGIGNQEYKISTCFESKNNVSKLENDKGNDKKRYERGINVGTSKRDSFYINGYGNWEIVKDDIESSQMSGNFNLNIDTQDMNNNINLYFNLLKGSKQILKFEMDNKGNRGFQEVEIKKPSNTIDFRDVINNVYQR